MEITEEQYARIKDSLPVQRGNVRLTNLQVFNAVLYIAEQGCKWRGLPLILLRFESHPREYVGSQGLISRLGPRV